MQQEPQPDANYRKCVKSNTANLLNINAQICKIKLHKLVKLHIIST